MNPEPKYKTCKRYNDRGHAHSLTFSCFHRRRHFNDDPVCRLLIDSIEAARRRHEFDLWAYVIMPDHVHLLICPRREAYSISTILAGIKRPVAYHANRLTTCEQVAPPEAFWQAGGGYDRNLFKSDAIYAEIEYIERNPVRKGLCELPEEWPFSSARFWAAQDDVLLQMDETVPPLGPVREL